VAALGDLGQVALLKARERRSELPRAALPALVGAWRTQGVLNAMTHWRRRKDFLSRDFEVSEARRRLAVLVRGTLGHW